MTNGCERYEEMLSRLLDGELSEREKAELSAHIAGCEHCGELAVALAAVSGALAEGLDEPPPGLHDKIMDKVSATARAQRGQARFRRLRPILAAAACVVVIAGTVLLANNGLRRANETTSNTAAAMPETALYLAGGAESAEGDAAADAPQTNGFAAASGDMGALYMDAMDAPASTAPPAAAETDAEKAAADRYGAVGGTMDTATEEAEEEPDVDEAPREAPAPLGTIDVEIAEATAGGYGASVLNDPNGWFAAGTALTVLTDEALSPGDRVTVGWISIGVGADTGGYYVTAGEITEIE